jgi:hypothetical protein
MIHEKRILGKVNFQGFFLTITLLNITLIYFRTFLLGNRNMRTLGDKAHCVKKVR